MLYRDVVDGRTNIELFQVGNATDRAKPVGGYRAVQRQRLQARQPGKVLQAWTMDAVGGKHKFLQALHARQGLQALVRKPCAVERELLDVA